jgi:signal transduction histidine kinase/ActR/RegA family two-component response regulator
MLLISYSTDYLYDHFKSVEFGRDAYLLVLDDQKRFIYHPDKSKIGATVTPAFGNLLQGASGSFLERIAGVDNLLSYSYLPDKKWYMVSVVPKRTLLAPMASIRRAAWVMLLLSSLLIALYVRIFTLRVVAPIGAIAQGFEDLQMERVASGWRMPEPRSLKPVVRLVKWFNAFLENLEKRQEAEHQLLEAHLKLKEMNQRLNERTVQAEEASNSKSQFLANMSHEIRTPMNAVIGYTQLLQRDPALSEQHRAFVATIGRSGQHLLELINDVLEMSKIEAGQSRLNATPFDFHALLGDLMTMFRVRMEEKGLTLDLDLGDTVPRHLCADVMKVKQVLINIIGNALKFTERGGVRITVQAGAPEAGRQEIAVAVQDTGIGFDESNMPTIFNAFEQADSARDKGGTGLGMAISRRYARMMDGDLTATSRIGTGSCFTFRFRPELGLGPAPELAARPREPRRLAPGSKVPRVLIVDDVAVNRVLIRHLLKPFGFNLAEGANGMECLSRMEEAQPDLVLMDSFMPVLDGLETTRRIRQHEPWRAIPVFLITASAFEEDRLRAEQAGVEAFLSKPVMLDVLCAAIERHVPGVVFEY